MTSTPSQLDSPSVLTRPSSPATLATLASTSSLRRRLIVPLLAVAFAAGCGQAAPNASPATPASSPAAGTSVGATPASGTAPAPAPTTAAVLPAGALRFQIVPNQSTATFRVREQLAGVQLPNDAVGSTGAVSGQIVLRPDGSLVGDASRISVDLRQLQTDNSRRDGFIKANTLSTDQFPTAEFAPTRATGLPNPLPASGEYTFTLIGPMTVRGVQRDVSWDVTARRDGSNLTAAATTSFKFGDFNLTQPQVPLVLSIADDIRLEVSLVANQASA